MHITINYLSKTFCVDIQKCFKYVVNSKKLNFEEFDLKRK